MPPSRDQQSIVCFHNNEIAHANDSNELTRRVDVVFLSVHHACARAGDPIAVRGLALRAVMLVQRGPGAEVVPAKIRGQAEDISGLFAFRRPGLKNRVVDADVFGFWIELAECRRKPSRAKRIGDLFEQTGGLGEMFTQCVDEGARLPQKYTAIPKIISRPDELACPGRVRLFRKPTNTQSSVVGRARLDVTVASLSPSRPNADHYNVLAGGRDLNAALQSFTKALFIGDHVVGWKHPDDGIRILPQQQKSCQADCRGGISSCRLSQHLRLR